MEAFDQLTMRACLLALLLSLAGFSVSMAEEHVVERGETSLQIAIDHDLTMAQLQQLNPGVDLEMMLVGDKLIVPDEGFSFEEYLGRLYNELLLVTDLHCEIIADHSALCFLHAENISDLPLFDVRLKISVQGQNGSRGEAEGDIALMQILPGEKLPFALNVPGNFDAVGKVSGTVQKLTRLDFLNSSFRIPETYYDLTVSLLSDRVGGKASVVFNTEGIAALKEKKINLLAAAYDPSGTLAGVRSLYSDFFPQLDITVYSNNNVIETIELRLEAY